MATKRRVRRPRKPRPVVEVKEVEVELEEEEILEEEEAPKPKRRRKKVAKPEPVVEEEYDDDEEDEEPAPKPKRRRKVKVVEPEPEPEPEVAEVTDLDIFYGLLEGMCDDGGVLTITRTGEETWTVSSGDCAPPTPVIQKLRGAAFWSEVCTTEYLAHEEEWSEMTLAEKKANAKKLKVKWETHEDARVDNIRMTQSVRAHLGITKYKAAYASRAARAAIRG